MYTSKVCSPEIPLQTYYCQTLGDLESEMYPPSCPTDSSIPEVTTTPSLPTIQPSACQTGMAMVNVTVQKEVLRDKALTDLAV